MAAGLLYNPAPGVKFRAADLVRNLLLSTLMHLSLEEQERKYKEMWLFRLEIPAGGPAALDSLLDAFLEAMPAGPKSTMPTLSECGDATFDATTSRHVSQVERYFEDFRRKMPKWPVDLRAMEQYARYLSHAERTELRRSTGCDSAQGEGPIQLSVETGDQLVTELLGFAQAQSLLVG